MLETVSVFDAMEHDDTQHRVASRRALAIAHQRVETHLGAFLRGAQSEEEFYERLALVQDDFAGYVATASTEAGHDHPEYLASALVDHYKLAAQPPKFVDPEKADEEAAEGEEDDPRPAFLKGKGSGRISPANVSDGLTEPLRTMHSAYLSATQKMALTARDFVMLADAIRTAPEGADKNGLANHFAQYLQHTNPNFDANRFLQAAGGTPVSGRDTFKGPGAPQDPSMADPAGVAPPQGAQFSSTKEHMPGVGDKRNRQYEHIKEQLISSGKSEEEAKEEAARTVNKQRAEHGETKHADMQQPQYVTDLGPGGMSVTPGQQQARQPQYVTDLGPGGMSVTPGQQQARQPQYVTDLGPGGMSVTPGQQQARQPQYVTDLGPGGMSVTPGQQQARQPQYVTDLGPGGMSVTPGQQDYLNNRMGSVAKHGWVVDANFLGPKTAVHPYERQEREDMNMYAPNRGQQGGECPFCGSAVMPGQIACPNCYMTNSNPYGSYEQNALSGEHQQWEQRQGSNPSDQRDTSPDLVTCPECGGNKKTANGETCPKCRGKGQVPNFGDSMVDHIAGDTTGLGKPEPTMNKQRQTPTNVGKPDYGDEAHPTKEIDILEPIRPANRAEDGHDLKEIGESNSEKVKLPANDNDAGFNTDSRGTAPHTKTFPKGDQASPVTNETVSSHNPLSQLLQDDFPTDAVVQSAFKRY